MKLIDILKKMFLDIFSTIKRYIPFTPEHRNWYTQELLRSTKIWLKDYTNTSTLDKKEKKQIDLKVRRGAILFNGLEVIFNFLESKYLNPFLTLAISTFSLATAPYIASYFLNTDQLNLSWLQIYLINIVLSFVFIMFTALPLILMIIMTGGSVDDLTYSKLVMYLVIIFSFYTVTIYKIQTQSSISYIDYSISLALITVILFFLATIVFIDPISLLFGQIKKRRLATVSDINIAHMLLRILDIAEHHGEYWGQIKFKQEIIKGLEEVANNIEENLPRQLGSGDKVTDYNIRKTCIEIAAFYRKKKQEIVFLKNDDLGLFVDQIKNDFLNIVNGFWNDLAKSEPEKLSVFQLGQLQFQLFFKTILSALLPLGVIYSIQFTPLSIDENILDYLVTASLIWLVITLLTVLDPMVRDKIISVKELLSVFFSIGKDKT